MQSAQVTRIVDGDQKMQQALVRLAEVETQTREQGRAKLSQEEQHAHVYRVLFFFSSRRRHTRLQGDWSSDVCSSDLAEVGYYTTSLAVQDLERVRAALGVARIDLYGTSYGTRVAQHYLRRFPQRVRALILDGVVPAPVVLGDRKSVV